MLIFVSYFAGIEGMVMSEWAEDKLKVSGSRFAQTTLITSIGCAFENRENVNVIRVPSISWVDFQWELAESRKLNQRTQLRLLAWIPIAASIGRIWDFYFAKVSRNSAARWSWAFAGLPIALLLKFRFPKAVLFCTGGATGGHLLGLIVNAISKVPLFLEFQDPLLGSEMMRSNSNEKGILMLERAFINRSTRTIFVTEAAANSARKRHPQLDSKIYSIYPGAWKILTTNKLTRKSEYKDIEFLHLGTLYGTRNLDNFFVALDNLKQLGHKNANRVKVKNLGELYLNNKATYSMRPDFENILPQKRSHALERAFESDALLLVQHADTRSSETIPYKTYDYLNLRRTIFGITNNPELDRLLDTGSNFLSNAGSVESIQDALMRFLNDFDENQNLRTGDGNELAIERQFAKIFE